MQGFEWIIGAAGWGGSRLPVEEVVIEGLEEPLEVLAVDHGAFPGAPEVQPPPFQGAYIEGRHIQPYPRR